MSLPITRDASGRLQILATGSILDAGTSNLIREFLGEGIVFSAADLEQALQEIGTEDATLVINSPGGLLTEGQQMADAVLRKAGQVQTHLAANTASAATLPFLAADKRTAAPGVSVLFHGARTPMVVVGVGTAEDHQASAEQMSKVRQGMREFLAARLPGTEATDLDKMVSGEGLRLTANDLLDRGILDSITSNATAAENAVAADTTQDPLHALAALAKKFHNLQARETPAPAAPAQEPNIPDPMNSKEITQALGLQEAASEGDVLNAITQLKTQAEQSAQEARASELKAIAEQHNLLSDDQKETFDALIAGGQLDVARKQLIPEQKTAGDKSLLDEAKAQGGDFAASLGSEVAQTASETPTQGDFAQYGGKDALVQEYLAAWEQGTEAFAQYKTANPQKAHLAELAANEPTEVPAWMQSRVR